MSDRAASATSKGNRPGLAVFGPIRVDCDVLTAPGSDRAAATAAFDRYLDHTMFSAAQIRIINLIVEHLTANGVMEVARLYESPFTDHAPRGPDMIFTSEQVDGIITILDEVRTHALPDVTVA